MKSDKIILQARNMTAGYGNVTVWENASFTINRGEFVGVLGPNGAGKTTLFRLMLGLAQPKSGTIEIFGDRPRRGNIKIGYVPQRHLIDEEFNIASIEIVRMGVSGTKWGFTSPIKVKQETDKALAALGAVGSEALAYKPLGQLSGGELQRVFLAQALVGEPDLMLLDEPLANLDIRREAELVNLISTIAKTKDVAVLLIAHDINPLLPVVNRLIYIVNGQLACGDPRQIINSESLSKLYGAQVEVLKDSHGRLAVLGTEGVVHHG